MKTQVKLSQSLLQRLRHNGGEIDRSAIADVGRAIGIPVGHANPGNWNKVITWLDENYPNWRGYDVEYTFAFSDIAAMEAD